MADALSTERTGSTSRPIDGVPQDLKRGFRFWIVIIGLGVTALLAALEHTVVITSAPVILTDLQLREDFVWITNAFLICSAAFQPLFGQLCDIFGRRWIYIAIVATFTLGSGICGRARTGGMLIAGRAVQGIGSGGIVLMNNVIVSDLVPLRERGKYTAVVLAIFSLGISTGPTIGGAIVNTTTWRWVFWINLPVGGVSLLIMFLFLYVEYDQETSLIQKIKRIDFIGNGILMAGTVAILYSLTYAGTVYAWSSWHTLVPLFLGFLGLLLFIAFEISGLPVEPVMPVHLFAHRTSVIVIINTFLNSTMYFWFLYFLPVYFQAAALYTPFRTGYSLLPMSLFGVSGAAVAAIALSIWGKFTPLHFAGFAITTLGMGLLSTMDENTSIAVWAVFQSIGALGIGIVIDTLLPAFQAPVAEIDQAAATAAWSFILNTISDSDARRLLSGGGAYQQASAAFVTSFSPSVQAEVRAVYREGLKRVFLIGIAFAGLATLLVLLERDIPLRQELDTRYGLKDDMEKPEKNGAGGVAEQKDINLETEEVVQCE
ncbi:major facilitator superfamily domain-containing protein [Hypoxylon trugodes]|uniref:major facilitator superfamily domain-containing protein n=1 Tax=Hypoxylon trugodes TaxID=326681 RepID=UPI0021A241EA|nr:major facilitator superfamily domain-containing protein [Hypoxylon trugodes]KAI1388755.1 major facilitator superfamily domain-containing protein [Hypoxylon trugodes]